MNKEELKFDHFEDIDELIQQIDVWYNDDELEYYRWFGLSDMFKMGLYIRDLENQIEYRNEIIKEAREKLLCYGETFDLKVHQQMQKELLEILDKGE